MGEKHEKIICIIYCSFNSDPAFFGCRVLWK